VIDIGGTISEMRAQGWIVGERLGGGGGGDVYLCYSRAFAETLAQGFADATIIASDKLAGVTRVVAPLQRALLGTSDDVALVKVPKLPDERASREIEAMTRCEHRHLTRLLACDNNLPARWFVMRYHPYGNLEQFQPEFHGRPREVLRKARPLVDAVAKIHASKLVHRDIKPTNVFVGHGWEWVLGDLGIAFDPEAERLTQQGARTLWSKDWRPDWVAARRLDEYRPTVDIYMLAKLIYYMISGRKVPASQLEEDDCDLRRVFPAVRNIGKVQSFLLGHVVTRERDIQSSTAETFASKMDALIGELERPRTQRHVFGWISTHSTTHVTVETVKSLAVPVPLTQDDKLVRCSVRLYALADPGTAHLDVHLRKENEEWTFVVQAPLEGGATAPGIWKEFNLDLEKLPRGENFYLRFGGLGSNVVITGLQVFVE
jgi:serine/threonine protein kinase